LNLSPHIYDVAWETDLPIGRVLSPYRNGKDTLASVIATGASIAEAECAANLALEHVPLEVDAC
jgi:hypothetical protein